MKGYKIAIGVDCVIGPFLAMVKLETFEDSIIVEPTERVRILNNPACFPTYRDLSDLIRGIGTMRPSPDEHKEQLTKYRTDAANVISVKPHGEMPEECWNKVAYSIWDIYNMVDGFGCFLKKVPQRRTFKRPLPYKAGQMVGANINMNKEEPCGTGIHFFATAEDALKWAIFDEQHFAIHVLNYCKILWESTTDNFVKGLCEF